MDKSEVDLFYRDFKHKLENKSRVHVPTPPTDIVLVPDDSEPKTTHKHSSLLRSYSTPILQEEINESAQKSINLTKMTSLLTQS